MDRASDAATYIEHGNVVSIGHHSSIGAGAVQTSKRVYKVVIGL